MLTSATPSIGQARRAASARRTEPTVRMLWKQVTGRDGGACLVCDWIPRSRDELSPALAPAVAH